MKPIPAMAPPMSWGAVPRSRTSGEPGGERPRREHDTEQDEPNRNAGQRTPGRLRRDLELDGDFTGQGGTKLPDRGVEPAQAVRHLLEHGQRIR